MNTQLEYEDVIANSFAELLENRRKKFIHIDEQGRYNGYGVFILTSLSNTIIIPLLFFIAANILDLYLNLGLNMHSIIWTMFTSITILLFWTPIFGYIYDHFEKNKKGWIKEIFVIIATLGIIICCPFLFRQVGDIQSAENQFQGALITFSFLFPIATISTIKSSVNFTPSQDDRRKLIFIEAVIYLVFLFLFADLPYWIQLGSKTCDCSSQCTESNSQECRTCYQQCDNFTGDNYFLASFAIMICVFGIINMLQYFAKYRILDTENGSSSFNRRWLDLAKNGFLIKTLIIVFLEYMIFFLLGFWFTYYVFYELHPENLCTNYFGYYCTRGFWFEWSILALVVISGIITIISRKYKYMSALWFWSSLLLILAGVYMAIFCSSQQAGSYIFILIFTSIYLATFPTTKTLFTNAIYYEEYITANSQPNFGSSLYIGAISIAFYFALALEFSFLSSDFTIQAGNYTNEVQNFNDTGTGMIITLFGLVIMILKYTYYNYDLSQFDKIQLAIEKNNSKATNIEHFSFKDPIAKQIIKKVIKPETAKETKLFYLLNTLNRSELKLVIKRKFDKIICENHVKICLLFFALVICILVLGLCHALLNTLVVWAFAIFFILLSIIPLLMLCYFNSARAAKILKGYEDDLYGVFFKNYFIWRGEMFYDEEKTREEEQQQKIIMEMIQQHA